MTKLIFRILFIGLGAWLLYLFGKDVVKPIQYRISGEQVTGRVEGFIAGRGNGTVVTDNTGVRKGKLKARRPVFRYPVAEGSKDSMSSRQGSGVLFVVFQYDLGEPVSVVFPKANPADAYIFSLMPIFTSFLLSLLAIYMLKIGVTGRA
jgi:Protein of unknown function (DUF3592)